MPMNAQYRGPIEMPGVIPVFPLPGALLLPRGQMPLNIFEPRYLAMVDDALRDGHRLVGMREKLLPTMPDPVRRYYERDRPIELRPVEFERYLGKKIPGGHFNIWIRTTGKLPDLPAIHQCVLAYASDMMLLDTALAPHGRTLFEKEFMAASLDHALWLHRPFRADDWLLYAQDSPNLHGSRGYARGLIFKRDGTLVASVAQEGLVRQKRET